MNEKSITIKEALMRAYVKGWLDGYGGVNNAIDDSKFQVAEELMKKLPENSQ
jgi:hypothetical protein